ncbi:MAG TPA: hypothetical protein PKE25_09335 [Novosphingobium sp.]|nr:hypothetical protein [Novosphingobium sp.]
MRRIEEIDAALSEIGAAIARRDRQAQELDAAIAGRLAAIERQIAAEDHEANLEASRLRSMLEEAHAAFGGKF